MIKRIGVILNTKKKKALPLHKAMKQFAKRKKLLLLDELEVGREKVVRDSELLVSLGGDGTLLNAVKYIEKGKMPIIGVNVGDFGFITEVSPDEMLKTIENTLKDRSPFSLRSLLEISLYRKKKKITSFRGLNDAVVTKGAVSRMMKLRIDIDGEFITSYFCDGLIVTTPTGSTAHSLSAGGPIIHPGAGVLAISPICPHTLTNRPLVINEASEISISPVGKEIQEIVLTVDGQESVPLKEKDILRVKVSPIKIKLILSGKRSYYKVLREKLKWGGTH